MGFCRSIACPFSAAKMIGWSFGINSWTNCTLYGFIPRSLCKILPTYVYEMFNCWERRWIDVDGALRSLSATAAIFSGVRTILGFGLSMRLPVSFTFFTRCLSSTDWWSVFQNASAIFAHILQHYHDFQINFAIFPSVVQAYTHQYLFSEGIKLIIWQIRRELSVTIHEISTSWKKMLDEGPNISRTFSNILFI